MRVKKGELAKKANKDITLNRIATPAPSFTSLYANDVQIETSLWDVRLIFGLITSQPTPVNMTVQIQNLGEVRFSVQVAKRVVKILAEQLNVYESKLGPIPAIGDQVDRL